MQECSMCGWMYFVLHVFDNVPQGSSFFGIIILRKLLWFCTLVSSMWQANSTAAEIHNNQ